MVSANSACRLFDSFEEFNYPSTEKRRLCKRKFPVRFQCAEGRGPDSHQILATSDNSKDSCESVCRATLGCLSFDWKSASIGSDACRLYSSTLNGQADTTREWCLPATNHAKGCIEFEEMGPNQCHVLEDMWAAYDALVTTTSTRYECQLLCLESIACTAFIYNAVKASNNCRLSEVCSENIMGFTTSLWNNYMKRNNGCKKQNRFTESDTAKETQTEAYSLQQLSSTTAIRVLATLGVFSLLKIAYSATVKSKYDLVDEADNEI